MTWFKKSSEALNAHINILLINSRFWLLTCVPIKYTHQDIARASVAKECITHIQIIMAPWQTENSMYEIPLTSFKTQHQQWLHGLVAYTHQTHCVLILIIDIHTVITYLSLHTYTSSPTEKGKKMYPIKILKSKYDIIDY